MATPEQKLFSKLKRTLESTVPKDRLFIQRIETSTGSGIPDVHLIVGDWVGWIETKTLDYKVTREQYAWASLYTARGGRVLLCTEWNNSLTLFQFDSTMLNYATLGAWARAEGLIRETVEYWVEAIAKVYARERPWP